MINNNILGVIIIILFCIYTQNIEIILFLLGFLFLFSLVKKTDSFDEKINNNLKVILFSSDSCPHCIDFKPEWDKFKSLNIKNIDTIEINSEKNQNNDIYNKYYVEGFPTIVIEKPDGKFTHFEGTRTSDNLVKFLQEF